jgi:urate oxidase
VLPSLHLHVFLVLKSTGSAFHGYIHDEYTTLPEVTDRILSTSVDLAYTFKPILLSPPTDTAKLEFIIPENFTPGSIWDGDAVMIHARNGTLDIFSLDESATTSKCVNRLISPVASPHGRAWESHRL